MPALYSSQPKSTQRVVCPKSRPDQPDSLLDNNNDHSTVDHNLPPPVAAIVVLNSSPKKSLLSVDAIDSFDVPPPQPTLPIVCGHGSDASSGFSYVLEEDQPEPPTSQATSITASQYESIKLPGNQKAIVTNHFLYIDPSVFSLVWLNVTLFFILHSLYMYSFYIIYEEKKWPALIVGYLFGCWGGLGVTAGAHRLWSHRSYSARWPLRVFLMIGHTIAGQNDLFVWCRDHRVHHKFSETDGDPHNSLRGFFFAHIGWLMRKKHPAVLIKGKAVPVDDIKTDPIVRFQIKYYYLLYAMFAFLLPTSISAVIYRQGWWYSFLVAGLMRYVTSLHCTWFVNSAAHMFGQQPYNPNIQSRENPYVSYGAFGEGYHNYHHSFPSDYATGELDTTLNLTKYFIDAMAMIGLVTDRKRVSPRLLQMRKANAIVINRSRQLHAY